MKKIQILQLIMVLFFSSLTSSEEEINKKMGVENSFTFSQIIKKALKDPDAEFGTYTIYQSIEECPSMELISLNKVLLLF